MAKGDRMSGLGQMAQGASNAFGRAQGMQGQPNPPMGQPMQSPGFVDPSQGFMQRMAGLGQGQGQALGQTPGFMPPGLENKMQGNTGINGGMFGRMPGQMMQPQIIPDAGFNVGPSQPQFGRMGQNRKQQPSGAFGRRHIPGAQY